MKFCNNQTSSLVNVIFICCSYFVYLFLEILVNILHFGGSSFFLIILCQFNGVQVVLQWDKVVVYVTQPGRCSYYVFCLHENKCIRRNEALLYH